MIRTKWYQICERIENGQLVSNVMRPVGLNMRSDSEWSKRYLDQVH